MSTLLDKESFFLAHFMLFSGHLPKVDILEVLQAFVITSQQVNKLHLWRVTYWRNARRLMEREPLWLPFVTLACVSYIGRQLAISLTGKHTDACSTHFEPWKLAGCSFTLPWESIHAGGEKLLLPLASTSVKDVITDSI